MNTLDKIFFLLKKNGISEAEFARRLNISRSVITDWKKGRNKSYNKNERLNNIAEILNVQIEYLLCDTNSSNDTLESLYSNTNISSTISNEDKHFTQILLSEDETKLIDVYRKLDDEGKVKVKYEAYSELRRKEQDGDKEKNRIFRTNNY